MVQIDYRTNLKVRLENVYMISGVYNGERK